VHGANTQYMLNKCCPVHTLHSSTISNKRY